MPIVYVVTAGEYSSYGICGVYSTLEMAEKVAADWGSVEWYALDDSDDTYRPWMVRMRKTGDHAEAHPSTAPNSINVIFRGRKDMHITVWAKTEQQAIKAANERRAWLIAEGIWSEGEEPVQVPPLAGPGIA